MKNYSLGNVVDGIRWFSEHSALRKPMVRCISAMQDYRPEVRVLAPALAFTCMCDALGLNPHEVITQVKNATHNVNGPFSVQYRAMTDYTRGEILKGE
jgi:hypothetical protein